MHSDPAPDYRQRPPCQTCGTGERVSHLPWCQACIDAAQAKVMQRLDQQWLETQRYVPQAPRPPDPALPPTSACPLCGPVGWVNRGSEQWGCRGCGRPPAS